MRSAVFSLPAPLNRLTHFAVSLSERLKQDLVFLSAAETSFFLVTSAVPFLSLIMALAGFLLKDNPAQLNLPSVLPAGIGSVLRLLAEEISDPPGVPLLSLNAVTTLWAASRGISSIRGGLDRIYRSEPGPHALPSRVAAIPTTLGVAAIIAGSSLLLFFGNTVASRMEGAAETAAKWLSVPVPLVLLTAVFTLLYAACGRKSPSFRRDSRRIRVLPHLPGAFFAAAGWLVFSLLYSYYIGHFPNASAVYGGLGAICLVMLWLYFCAVIFLLGAECNLLIAERRNKAEE